MLNTAQTALINELTSRTASHASGTCGNDVQIFTAGLPMDEALRDLGFTQNIKRDKFGMTYGYCFWWNDEHGVLISTGGDTSAGAKWSVALDYYVLTSADYSDIHV